VRPISASTLTLGGIEGGELRSCRSRLATEHGCYTKSTRIVGRCAKPRSGQARRPLCSMADGLALLQFAGKSEDVQNAGTLVPTVSPTMMHISSFWASF
jgi:hypothetical protein